MPHLVPTVILATVLVSSLVGCGGSAAPTFDPNEPATGPLVALSECDGPPDPAVDADVEGIELPPDATISSVTPQGPLINVTAYVPITPVNVRLFYENRDDLEILIIEDEVFEAELLVSNGTHRTYVKASAICQTGSTAVVIVAAELDAEGLPVPAGALGGAPTAAPAPTTGSAD